MLQTTHIGRKDGRIYLYAKRGSNENFYRLLFNSLLISGYLYLPQDAKHNLVKISNKSHKLHHRVITHIL